MRTLVTSLKRLYQNGEITLQKVEELYRNGKITYDEYEYIINI